MDSRIAKGMIHPEMNTLIPENELTLEKLQNDPSVALISDEVGSWEELIRNLMDYLKLPRSGRRFSDYYSVELYGCNVPAMFVSLQYRFKPDNPFQVKETLFFSEPDLYYNKKAFDEGRINLCFVIGYSGSGKSELTREYEGDGIEKVELDNIVCVKDHYTLEDLKAKGDLLYSFFTGEGSKYYISREERDVFADHGEVFVKFIKYAQGYAASHPERKFILEGIWTYLFFDYPSDFEKYAVYMKGTSLAKSKIRRLIRESNDSVDQAIDRLIDFGIYAMDSALHDSNVDKWRHYFEKKEATIIKEEDNNFTRLRDSIMAEINNINYHFVHGDAAAIEGIMEKAKGSEEMDMREKAIVVEECRKAIADLSA